MSVCKKCRARIRWAKTDTGSHMMPLDSEPTSDGNVIFVAVANEVRAHVLHKGEEVPDGQARFTPHFATCPSYRPPPAGQGQPAP